MFAMRTSPDGILNSVVLVATVKVRQLLAAPKELPVLLSGCTRH
jgi:hypothetical protein